MKNLAASVHQRLRSAAAASRVDFNSVAIRYVNERFLARLAASEHRERFVLKGATMLTVWLGEAPRRTRDVDLLRLGEPDPVRLAEVLGEMLRHPVDDDAVTFDVATLATSPIREERVNLGGRATFDGAVGKMRIRSRSTWGSVTSCPRRPHSSRSRPCSAATAPACSGTRARLR